MSETVQIIPADDSGVYRKLGKIQEELFVPKGNKNDFGGYKYRTCEDILKVVKPLCAKNNCVIRISGGDLKEIGGELYRTVVVYFYDLDTNKCLVNKETVREAKDKKGQDPSQMSGSSISYARKYALAGLFCIDNEKDADVTNKHGKDEEETHDTVSAQQLNAIYAELERTGVSESVILDSIKKKHLEEATQADYLTVMKRLNKTADK